MSTIESDPSDTGLQMKEKRLKYHSYFEVPFYRQQWFFWLSYLIVPPVAFFILAFGDVYYQKRGELKSFGIVNRIVAALFLLILLAIILTGIFFPPEP